jgi:hypothetical protein
MGSMMRIEHTDDATLPIPEAVAIVAGEFSEVRQDGEVYWLQTVLLKRPQQLPFGAPLYTAPQQPAAPSETVNVLGMPEFDGLLDHIYEYGTESEGVIDEANAFARAVIARYAPRQPAAVDVGVEGLVRDLVCEIERNTCTHEETHRGGVLWEICDLCGAKWADDRGGRPEFQWPDCVERAREWLTQQQGQAVACRWPSCECPNGTAECPKRTKADAAPPPSAPVGVDVSDLCRKARARFSPSAHPHSVADWIEQQALAQQSAAESEQSIKADAYDMIAESVEKSGVRVSSIVDYVVGLIQQPAAVNDLAARLVDELDGLVSESDGVSGLHLNGDLAPWDELLPGGRFECLSSLDELREALASTQQQGQAVACRWPSCECPNGTAECPKRTKADTDQQQEPTA